MEPIQVWVPEHSPFTLTLRLDVLGTEGAEGAAAFSVDGLTAGILAVLAAAGPEDAIVANIPAADEGV